MLDKPFSLCHTNSINQTETMIKSKLQQRLDELCVVRLPTVDELKRQSVEEIYPDLVGDDYADAMLADLANS